ncbi:MAG: type I methionyl aminopeptidase [Planctomycetota bacterium]|nr:type I methionyl aminopeptidase [Planctomycetota bacterium]
MLRKNSPRLDAQAIEKMRVVGRFACSLLDMVEAMVRPGITTLDIDKAVHRATRERGAVSAPYGYTGGGAHPFPKHCCTSVNEVVCHGIPHAKVVLKEGDIINVDVTPIIDGYHGDTSRTFMVGEVTAEAKKLVQDTHEAMRRGIAAVKPGGHVGDIGHAIQSFAEPMGYGVVEQFAGHGIGKVFHDSPSISHVGRRGKGEVLLPGMTFTVEPMLNLGTAFCVVDKRDHWTARTYDGALSAQFEHTVTVTNDGVEILTLPDDRPLDLTVAD